MDADRIAIWVYSGGGLLLVDWLHRRPEWLRCVPHGRHGFDMLDHTDESRKAVEQALDIVLTTLT